MYDQICEICGENFESKRPVAKSCSDKCRKESSRRYSADNMKINKEKFDQRYDWRLAEDLATKYTKPIEWIRRSIKACRLSGVSPEYFIDKYLMKKDIEKNELVSENMRNMVIDCNRLY